MTQNRRKSKKVEPELTKEETPNVELKVTSTECDCGLRDSMLTKIQQLTEIIEEREGTISAFKKEVQSKSDFIKHLENSISVKEDALNLSREKADRYSKELSKLNSFGKWLYGINY